MLEAGRCTQQAGNLVPAQHHREFAHLFYPYKPSGKIGPVECMGEEEAQGRDHAVHGRHWHTRLALRDLEPAQIFRCRRIGWSSQERSEAPDIADLQAEIATLRRENAELRELGGSVSGRLDAAINRLKLVLEA